MEPMILNLRLMITIARLMIPMIPMRSKMRPIMPNMRPMITMVGSKSKCVSVSYPKMKKCFS